MSLKHVVFSLRQMLEDNPAIAVLAGCCVGAGLFFGLMVMPRYWRRWKRRAREKRRKAAMVEGEREFKV
jgi:hypothetical protein